MANETIWVQGATKTLEANGASTVGGAFTQADDAAILSADVNGFPWADFVLTLTYGVAPASGDLVEVYARPLNIDGTSDAPVPAATFRSTLLGAFMVNTVTTAQTLLLTGVMLPHDEMEIYIHNASAQTISVGWNLKVTPKTLKPSA